jgi:hypothetical protein
MRILTTGLAAAALLLGTSALTTPAFATQNNGGQDHTCQGGNNCNTGGGGTTDIDNTNTAVGVGIGVGYGGEGGKGGQGGKGGEGGDANSLNINTAKGGEVKNSGNSFNANVNKNEAEVKNSGNSFNVNDNDNKNINKNENKNYNTNVNANSNHQSQGQGQDQKQGQLQGQAQSVDNVGNVNIENERPPVNTAYSAALATSEDTCMGSSSIGAQAVSFGLTLGTTWQDDNCRRLKNSRQLVALGYHRAATALMCFDEDVSAAMERAGTPCPNGPAPAVFVPPPPPREYVPMAPVRDEPVRHHRRHKKPLPPK